MKIVVDTNVIVSGLREGPQPPFQILDLWREGEIDILASEDTIAELERVLRYPRVRQLTAFSEERIQQFIEEFREETVLIEVKNEVNAVPNDPTDNKFLALAIAGDAGYIVTGDIKHLLPLRSYGAIEIISPAAFITLKEQ